MAARLLPAVAKKFAQCLAHAFVCVGRKDDSPACFSKVGSRSRLDGYQSRMLVNLARGVYAGSRFPIFHLRCHRTHRWVAQDEVAAQIFDGFPEPTADLFLEFLVHLCGIVGVALKERPHSGAKRSASHQTLENLGEHHTSWLPLAPARPEFQVRPTWPTTASAPPAGWLSRCSGRGDKDALRAGRSELVSSVSPSRSGVPPVYGPTRKAIDPSRRASGVTSAAANTCSSLICATPCQSEHIRAPWRPTCLGSSSGYVIPWPTKNSSGTVCPPPSKSASSAFVAASACQLRTFQSRLAGDQRSDKRCHKLLGRGLCCWFLCVAGSKNRYPPGQNNFPRLSFHYTPCIYGVVVLT